MPWRGSSNWYSMVSVTRSAPSPCTSASLAKDRTRSPTPTPRAAPEASNEAPSPTAIPASSIALRVPTRPTRTVCQAPARFAPGRRA